MSDLKLDVSNPVTPKLRITAKESGIFSMDGVKYGTFDDVVQE